MSDIKPFKGLLPKPEFANIVASPPYDVLSSAEAKEMVKENPYSFLNVIKPEITFESLDGVSTDDLHYKGKENLHRLISDGYLNASVQESYYIYQQEYKGHVQTGVVLGASVSEYQTGKIKKHEFTRPDKENDRARHIELVGANTGPVFLTYKQSVDIDVFIESNIQSEPYFAFTADDGVSHRLWQVTEQGEVSKLTELFDRVPALYIADGHHRSAAAARLKEAHADVDGEAFDYFLAVVFPDNQLNIIDYNRVLFELNGHSPETILERVSQSFECELLTVNNSEEAKPRAQREFGMYLDGKWYRLSLKSELIPDNDPVGSLDVSLLQNIVLKPLFGIENPRTDKRIDFVGGIRGLKELERRCSIDSKVAFALFPTSIDQLISIADAGEVMPPKSTWFEPKLRSGVVVRPFS